MPDDEIAARVKQLAEPEMSLGEEFRLDARVPDGHSEAAAFWGVNRQTLRRWKLAGVAAGDPCPYKVPEQMVEWYGRVFDKAVPEAIHATLARLNACPQAAPAAEVMVKPGATMEVDGSMLERLKQHEKELFQRYRVALSKEGVEERTLARYREEWEQATVEVSKHEQRAKKTGDLLPPEEFEHAFRRMMEALPQAIFRSLPARLSKEERLAAAREACGVLPDTLEEMLAA